MKRFQYKFVRSIDIQNEHAVNTLGGEGWELVTIYTQYGVESRAFDQYIFKRELDGPERFRGICT